MRCISTGPFDGDSRTPYCTTAVMCPNCLPCTYRDSLNSSSGRPSDYAIFSLSSYTVSLVSLSILSILLAMVRTLNVIGDMGTSRKRLSAGKELRG